MPFYAGYSYTLSSDRSFLGLLGLSGLWWKADKPCDQCFIQPGITIPSYQIFIFWIIENQLGKRYSVIYAM